VERPPPDHTQTHKNELMKRLRLKSPNLILLAICHETFTTQIWRPLKGHAYAKLNLHMIAHEKAPKKLTYHKRHILNNPITGQGATATNRNN